MNMLVDDNNIELKADITGLFLQHFLVDFILVDTLGHNTDQPQHHLVAVDLIEVGFVREDLVQAVLATGIEAKHSDVGASNVVER